jgi:hypothetical protein
VKHISDIFNGETFSEFLLLNLLLAQVGETIIEGYGHEEYDHLP